jgi:2-succinyl-6-hydroxy-2,4-cyclohexadiene-1-carboxylate synthase
VAAVTHYIETAVPAVLLHGFAGTARHWERVTDDALALELADADPLSTEGVAGLIAARAPERFTLAGYSMGGRLALHAALALPDRVSRLVLISTSAGIEDAGERERRRAADEELADEIERNGIEWFVERWQAVALFAEDPPWVAEEVAREERRCAPATLAACLRALGSGAMVPMWDRLGELAMPVAILAGERDTKYVAAAERLASAIPNAELTIVPGAGHRLALEAPDAVARALSSDGL